MSGADSGLAQCFQTFQAAYPLRRRRLNGVSWQYLVCGDGAETLLLLPGAMGEAATSFQYCLAFAPQLRVISVSYPPELVHCAALSDGLAALLAAEEVRQAHVVGGSYSGLIAQHLVRRHPERVASLILAYTGVPQPARARTATLLMLALTFLPERLLRAALRLLAYAYLPQLTPDHAFWRGYMLGVIATIDRAYLLTRLRVLADFDRGPAPGAHDLAHWPGRVLILDAAHDGFFGNRERQALHRLYPQASIRILADADHRAAMDRPEATIAAIMEFLVEIRNSSVAT